ncbi:MAG TPA: PilX N-terminal domain-containing pilus assembly protein [Burkholderiaceae bacterium]|jgi:type IV pilus assembly protein PilX
MNQRRPLFSRARRRHADRGFILVIGLLFMLVLLLLSASMFRSFTMQEKIAGNTRDKQRSFEAAQGALQYGETWLGQGNAGTQIACTASNQAIASLAVCSGGLATPALEDTWPGWYSYKPAGMVVLAGGGLATGGDINYQAMPRLYVSYLGLTADANGSLYQVTAMGQGGSSETRSVVQSTYRLQSQVTCGSCP